MEERDGELLDRMEAAQNRDGYAIQSPVLARQLFGKRMRLSLKKFAKNAKILQFDVDAAEVNKNIHTDAPKTDIPRGITITAKLMKK